MLQYYPTFGRFNHGMHISALLEERGRMVILGVWLMVGRAGVVWWCNMVG